MPLRRKRSWSLPTGKRGLKFNIWEQKTIGQPATKLPVIIPIVVYHGQARWTSPLKLSGLIEDYEQLPLEVVGCLPDFSYLLYNISRYSNSDIKGSVKLQRHLFAIS